MNTCVKNLALSTLYCCLPALWNSLLFTGYQNSKNKAQSTIQPQVTKHTPNHPLVSDSGSSRPSINKNVWSNSPTTTVLENTTTSPQPVHITARTHPYVAVPSTTGSYPVMMTTVSTVSRPHPSTTTVPSSQGSVPTPFTTLTTGSRGGNVLQLPVTMTGGSGRGHTSSERAGQGSSGFNVGKPLPMIITISWLSRDA